jgi:hypothetical protein
VYLSANMFVAFRFPTAIFVCLFFLRDDFELLGSSCLKES